MAGHSTASRGPLVICRDTSGSMHDVHGDRPATNGHPGRNTIATGCMVALTRVAHAGERMVRVVHFGTATTVSELKPGDCKAVLDATREWLGGGTKIGKALQVAVQQVGELEKLGYFGADIVLLTDGEDPQHAEMDAALNECAQRGIRLWTVAIECSIPDTSPIRWRAEKLIRVGATLEADVLAVLREAAENTVSPEEQAARAKAAN